MHGDGDRWLVRGAMRAVLPAGVRLGDALPPAGDPDRLLTDPACTLVKFQRKVVVGRMPAAGGALYVKRYNVWSPRIALAHLGRPSPALRAWQAARALARAGFAVPEAVAAVEERRCGILVRSFFVTREVPDAATADVAWQTLRRLPPGRERRVRSRAFAAALGALYRRLHDARILHRDLKDVNVLVRADGSCVLLDLEQVRTGVRVGERARRKSLVQLARTLGRLATRTDALRVLRSYLGTADRATRRAWAAAIVRAAAAKDRRHPPRRERVARPEVAGVVVCQDEAAHIGQCLASLRWCDELVVVDGGSRDRTPEIAAAWGARVIRNPWPGYRAQKQFALERATAAWAVSLDADERATDELATEIRDALAGVPEDVAGFAAPRLVAYLGRWWRRGGWYPRPVVRVLRRGRARWAGVDPHDRAEVDGRVVRLHHPIIHHTYADAADHLRSVDKLTAVAAAQVPPGRRVGAGRLVIEPGWRFLRSSVLARGVWEGAPGLFVAATDAFYTFLRFARVWARRAEGA